MALKADLSSTGRPTVKTWNPRTERYDIYVMALERVVSLKPENVILDAGTVGRVTGLTSKQELNGRWSTIKEWIRETMYNSRQTRLFVSRQRLSECNEKETAQQAS
jgi:hypothetical protein